MQSLVMVWLLCSLSGAFPAVYMLWVGADRREQSHNLRYWREADRFYHTDKPHLVMRGHDA